MALKETLEWNPTPPAGLSFQTHKFSLLDVVELASMKLETDYTAQREMIITGQKGRVILATLPHIALDPGVDGLLIKTEEGYALIGTIGRRRVLFDMAKEMFGKLKLTNGTNDVCIIIPEAAGNGGDLACGL
jgi:hypothetical protein